MGGLSHQPLAYPLEEVRIFHWHQDRLLEQALCLRQSNDVREAHVWISVDNLVLDGDCQISQIRIVAEIWQGFQHAVLEELFNLLIRVFLLWLLLYHSTLDRKVSPIKTSCARGGSLGCLLA